MIASRYEGHTGGPWRWEVNRKSKRVQLCGGEPNTHFGKFDYTVLDFVRYGMDGAAPNFWTWKDGFGDLARADALAVPAPGREHHADWFALIDHPDARLIEDAPILLKQRNALAEALYAVKEANDDCIVDIGPHDNPRQEHQCSFCDGTPDTGHEDGCPIPVVEAALSSLEGGAS